MPSLPKWLERLKLTISEKKHKSSFLCIYVKTVEKATRASHVLQIVKEDLNEILRSSRG
jgi:hypothetical protein